MKKNKLKIRSVHENLRLCVIENAIFVEELISEVIGDILNIDWKESKSFSFSSSALSFNQKVQIIQDIKGIDKQDLKKFTCVMNIRNKFAHVSHIKTFEDLFAKSSVGKENKLDFLKWYFNEKGVSDIPKNKHEFVFRLCFYLLIDNVVDILFKIYGDHMFEIGKQDGEKEFKDKFIIELIDYLKGHEGGQKAINDVIEELEKTVYNNNV
jgi:hypothetical protein